MMREYIRKYHLHQIKRYYGLDFIDFMGLPIDIADYFLQMANELSEEDTQRAAAHANRMSGDINAIEKGLENMGDVLTGNVDYY